VWRGSYRPLTIGIVALITLVAFEGIGASTAMPAVAISPVPAIAFLVDVVSRDRRPSHDNKPWTLPKRSFDQRVEWMVDLFGRLEQRERANR
jgi:hypothetical protein